MVKNSMIPLYQQLSEEIRKQITDGTYKQGDKLPTEAEFSRLFDVSRITVRKAIELLADDGYVVRKQGIGTFVAEKRLHRVVNNQILSFTEMSRLDGHEPSAELVSLEWIVPNGSVERHLCGEDPQKVLKIVRVRKNDGRPVMLETNYYPKKLSFLMDGSLLGSTYEIFRSRGLIPSHSVKTVEICYATEEEAALLEVEPNEALILQKDETFDQNEEPLHFAKLVINPRRYLLTIII